MRAFIAIELSDEIKETLSQAQAHLKYSAADVKWVDKSNIHLTLKFLGEINEETCGKVKIALDRVAKETKPFEITLKDLGAFPNIDFPRVVWVGLDRGSKECCELVKRIDEVMRVRPKLSSTEFGSDPFSFAAHLTIGRVRSGKNKQALKEKMSGYRLPDPGPQTIDSVILFRSTLTPTGPIYTKLHEASFS